MGQIADCEISCIRVYCRKSQRKQMLYILVQCVTSKRHPELAILSIFNQSLSLSLFAGEMEKLPPRSFALASLTFSELLLSLAGRCRVFGLGVGWTEGNEPSGFAIGAFISGGCSADVPAPWGKAFGWSICMDDEFREADEEDVLGVAEWNCSMPGIGWGSSIIMQYLARASISGRAFREKCVSFISTWISFLSSRRTWGGCGTFFGLQQNLRFFTMYTSTTTSATNSTINTTTTPITILSSMSTIRIKYAHITFSKQIIYKYMIFISYNKWIKIINLALDISF